MKTLSAKRDMRI